MPKAPCVFNYHGKCYSSTINPNCIDNGLPCDTCARYKSIEASHITAIKKRINKEIAELRRVLREIEK